jgi:hypothetical protein
VPDGADRRQRVCDVPYAHLPAIWPRVEHFIAAALDTDECHRYLPTDVYQLLLARRGRLWVSWDRRAQEFDGAAVTEIIQTPRCRECRVWLLGGKNWDRWRIEMRDMIEAYARADGCQYVTGSGSRGWVRAIGYQESGVNLVHPLYSE